MEYESDLNEYLDIIANLEAKLSSANQNADSVQMAAETYLLEEKELRYNLARLERELAHEKEGRAIDNKNM